MAKAKKGPRPAQVAMIGAKPPTVGDVVDALRNAIALEAGISAGFTIQQDPQTLLVMLFATGTPEEAQAAVQRALAGASLPRVACHLDFNIFPAVSLQVIKKAATSPLDQLYLPNKTID